MVTTIGDQFLIRHSSRIDPYCPLREVRSVHHVEHCYLCGGANPDSRDHVPPRCFFDRVPANMITLPACTACNRGAALDEEYLRTSFAALCYAHSAAARRVWEGAVRRAFRRRQQGLRAGMARGVRPIVVRDRNGRELGRLPGLAVDGARSLTVIRKIAKGIYFLQTQQRIANPDMVVFRGADIPLAIVHLHRHPQWGVETDMGEAFRFRWGQADEGCAIWMEFYRHEWWEVFTGDLARNYPGANPP